MAKTHTSAKTFTRIKAVKLQFKHALVYASELDKAYIDLLLECIEKHYICSFSFHGFNVKDECEVELTLNIDWKQHEILVKVNDKIYLNKRTTTNGVSMITSDWTHAFLTLVKKRGLTKKITWIYTDEVNNDKSLYSYVSTLLKSKKAGPVKYADTMVNKDDFTVYETPEINGILKH